MSRTLFVLLITAVMASAQTVGAQKLRQDLHRQPFDAQVLLGLSNPTQEIVDVLRDELRTTPDARREQREKKKAIAASLCRLKRDYGIASAYLIKLAEEAIATDPPGIFVLDQNNRPIRGRVTPAFERWAAEHNLTTSDAVGREVFEYPSHLLVITYLEDPKFIYLFRRGLDSKNVGVVIASITGLASLNDLNSLPLIRAAAERPVEGPERHEGFAMGLATFAGDRAAAEIRRVFAGSPILPMYENRMAHQHRR